MPQLRACLSRASRLELRVAEIEAELDALTGGAFTRLSRRHDEGGFADP